MSQLKVNAIRHTSASSDAVTLATDGTCTAKITNNLSNRNLIINGAMQVAQRGTSSTSSGHQTVDRFSVNHSIQAAPTQAQVDVAAGTTPYTLGFRKALKITNGNQSNGAQASDIFYIRQLIESQDIAQSGWNYTSTSSYITLSFWVKSSVAQNFHGHIKTIDGTEQILPFQTGSLTANTWTKITKVIPGNSNLQFDTDTATNAADKGLQVSVAPYMGTTYTASSAVFDQWQAYSSGIFAGTDMTTTWFTTDDATFEITGVQLEVGDVATDFEHRSYGDELLRCQRYYYVLADGSALADQSFGNGIGWSSSQIEMTAAWPVVMRTAPSLVHSTGTNYYQWRNGSNDKYTNSLLISSATTRHAIIYKNSMSGITVGMAFRVQLGDSSAYVHLNAEL